MEHKSLSLEYDRDLINRILDDENMRYIVLFLYIIRNDLFRDLKDETLIESYNRVLILDEIYKANLLTFWDDEFLDIAIDLGLIKNIRTKREFEQKDQDFIIKLGEETITIEGDTVSVPADTLYMMITKKYKSINRRDFNLALTRLKSVRCEVSGVIHSFIFQISEEDYAISDDLYYILDQFGNVYQTIKIEHTVEGFSERFNQIYGKLLELIEIFDPVLNNKKPMRKTNEAIEQNKDIIEFLKEERIGLSDKFNMSKIDKNESMFKDWYSRLTQLLNFRYNMQNIDKEIKNIKSYYSGKEKKYNYLEFIEMVSFNEDEIVDRIREDLISLRKKIIEINDVISKLSKKQIKLLNLDFERFLIEQS
ncbi:MAG: hypothetical protein ACQERB_12615 [Promethearchaeati archaeon]